MNRPTDAEARLYGFAAALAAYKFIACRAIPQPSAPEALSPPERERIQPFV